MSEVHHAFGAPDGSAELLSREAAEVLTESIRAATARVLDALTDVERDIRRAYDGRAWLALGYLSWADYCASEFSDVRLWTSVEERHARTLKFREAGLSQRAIAALLGVDQATVSRELSGDADASPDVPGVQGVDGRSYPQRRLEDAQLLARRLEVLRLRDSGMSQQEVAARLRVSQATVSTDEKAIGELLAEVSEEQATRIDELVAQGDPDVDVVAEALGVEVLHARFDMGDVLADDAGGKAKEIRRVSRALHDEVIFREDFLVSDVAHLRKTTGAAAPALAEALQSVARCLWRLDGRLLDDKTRARAAAAVDVAINDLRRWREKAG